MIQIIYTRDMEPITALDVPPAIITLLQRQGFASVPVPNHDQVPQIEMVAGEALPRIRAYKCRLEALSTRPLLIVTDDEEQALALTSVWLPGQVRAVHAAWDEGYNTGAAKALRMLLR